LLQDFEFTESRKLVDHGQEFVLVGGLWASVFKLDFIGQKSRDYIDNDPNIKF
jgi:hypothetical protein